MRLKTFKTYNQKATDLKAQWYIVDALDLPLGRLAGEVSKLLVGKHKPTYTPHLNNGDWVIVINSDKFLVTGRKEEDKTYYRHSGYVGNLRQTTLAQQREKDSTKIIYTAIKGMLPKNKLRDLRLSRLKIYKTTDHPHQAQQPNIYKINLKGQ